VTEAPEIAGQPFAVRPGGVAFGNLDDTIVTRERCAAGAGRRVEGENEHGSSQLSGRAR
jgi:hypothetical protein